jgi:DNA mismatch repair protein MutL
MEAIKKIKRLPTHVVDLIKAGEVIERPASVVKELFENSVDALSDDIVVELIDGGKELIRVIDNGTGIVRQDLALALERHATSKLDTVEDLDSLSSFGFRGEALASLAAVGRFSIRTKTESDALGVEWDIRGLEETVKQEVVMNRGTTVTLKEIFGAVPARRKFLKATATELAHVQDYLSSISLAYPGVSVTLKHNGRVVFQLKKTAILMDRLVQIYSDAATEMMPFSYERGKIRIEGFAGKPEFARSSARLFVTFVNGRIVKDRFLRGGVLQAYSGLTIKGLSSSCVLYVSLDPSQVDVNAHPAKTEVRFWDPPVMQDLVTIALQSALKAAASQKMMGNLDLVQSPLPPVSRSAPPEHRTAASNKPSVDRMVIGRNENYPQNTLRATTSFSSLLPKTSFDSNLGRQNDLGVEFPKQQQAEKVRLFENSEMDMFGGGKYLGQFLNCYLIFERGTELLIVDQHAFHERILYEEIVVKKSPVAIQDMITPILIPVTGVIGSLVNGKIQEFKNLGFATEVLQQNEIALHSFPAFLSPSRVGEVFEEILARVIALEGVGQEDHHPLFEKAKRCQGEFESLSPMERNLEASSVFHILYATLACHSAVRSGDPLAENQVKLLLRQSQGVDFFAHCPHGRPVSKVWAKKEVEQWFLRI